MLPYSNRVDSFYKRLREECYLNGKEKDPAKTAEILLGLARHQMETNRNEIGMIKSALLLNGALTRDRGLGPKVKNDLSILWQTILELSDAKNRNTTLISLTSQLKEEVLAMRKNASQGLRLMESQMEKARKEKKETNFKKVVIRGNQALQLRTSEDVCRLLKNLYDNCVKIMGSSPCKFSVVGLGPLAEKEVTPFSEFHHAILLENKAQNRKRFLKIKKYFSWLSVLFHVVVINLGETPISSVPIDGLEWFSDYETTPGLSSCAVFRCKTNSSLDIPDHGPPGPFDFVKTVDEMLKQIRLAWRSRADENDVVNLFQNTCYIAGNDSLQKSFQKKVFKIIESYRRTDQRFYSKLQEKINYDKKNLDVIENMSFLHASKPLDYKRVVYKSLNSFVTVLGIVYGIKKASSFDIIHKLQKKKLIEDDESQVLLCAVALAFECRHRVSVKHSKRAEYSFHGETFREAISELEKAIGVTSLVEVFSVAIRLEQAISDIGKLTAQKKMKLEIPANSLMKATVLCALHLFSKCLNACQKLQKRYSSESPEARLCRFLQAISYCNLNKPNDALKLFRLSLKKIEQGKKKIICFYYIGLCFIKSNDPNLAVNYLKDGHRMQMDKSIEEGSDIGLARFLFQLGFCSKKRGLIKEALTYFHRGLEIRLAFPDDFKDGLNSSWLNEVAHCYYQLQDTEHAIEYFKRSVHACKLDTRDEKTDKRLVNLLFNLGSCFYENQRYDEALPYFEEELQILLNLNQANNRDLAECQEVVERCRSELAITTIF